MISEAWGSRCWASRRSTSSSSISLLRALDSRLMTVCVLGKERSPLPMFRAALQCWMAEALSALSMTLSPAPRSSSHSGCQRRSTEKAKAWNVPP